MSEPAIRVENLGKKYLIGHQKSGDLRSSISNKLNDLLGRTNGTTEEFWALRDVSFEVQPGEAVGIIGRNGAGKSTLLKILSRITDPTTGRFEINGRVSSLLEVGTGFHQELTGRENIYLNGTILGMKRSEIKAKFEQIVDFSGVEKFLDTPVKHYSSGMKVRLAFSVAAHLEPEILIVDEVLAVGDAEFQKKCLGKMDEVSKTEGRTVLFVSHNMGAVQSLCTRGIVIKQGMVIRNDSIERAVLEYIRVTSSKNDKSIEFRNDRLGGDKFRFKGVKFFDISSNLELDIVVSGQSINIIINSESKLPERENLVLSIGFFTVEGVFLFACKSDVIGVNLKSSNSEHVCSINKFPLKRGVYKYNLAAYYDGEMVDHLVNAGELIVEDGDFYGTGKLPATSKSGGVLIEFNWRNG